MLPALQFLTLDGLPIGHAEQARLACEGGVRWVQLRAKGLAVPAWTEVAREVVAVCRKHGALCTVNDSPEVAREAGANGVHLGKSDVSPVSARALLGPNALIGVTLNHPDDIRRLDSVRVDYVGAGPFRATATKLGHAPVHSDDSLRALIAAARLPAYVIGGVTRADFPALRLAGAHGAAVSAAIARAEDPRAAARELVAAASACWPSA